MMRLVLSLLLTVPFLTACLDNTTTIAVLLADGSGDMRSIDVEALTERIESSCDDCVVDVHDAEGDADVQAGDAQEVAEDADLVVVWPVDPEAAESFDFGATPVVSVVELVPGSDRFVGLAQPLDAAVADQGSELDAARAVVAGERKTMTHVPALAMGEQAADVVLGVLADEPVPDGEQHEGVESWLFEATEVNVATLTTVLVGEGVVTLEDLCEGDTAQRCRTLGLV